VVGGGVARVRAYVLLEIRAGKTHLAFLGSS
jgi:hypothetical protein